MSFCVLPLWLVVNVARRTGRGTAEITIAAAAAAASAVAVARCCMADWRTDSQRVLLPHAAAATAANAFRLHCRASEQLATAAPFDRRLAGEALLQCIRSVRRCHAAGQCRRVSDCCGLVVVGASWTFCTRRTAAAVRPLHYCSSSLLCVWTSSRRSASSLMSRYYAYQVTDRTVGVIRLSTSQYVWQPSSATAIIVIVVIIRLLCVKEHYNSIQSNYR